MMADKKETSTTVVALRWSARILGVLTASFLLLMFFGYVLQGRGPSPDSLAPIALVGLALMATYTLAMLLALRWERAASLIGAVVLGCFFAITFLGLLPGNVSGGFSARGVLNPLFLALWVPVLLYLLCWWLERRRRS